MLISKILLFTISVDRTDPVARCPQNIRREIPLPQSSTSVTWQQPTATDNSGIVTLQTNSHDSGDTFNVGVTTVSYTFVDSVGNTDTCTFDVEIVQGNRRFHNCCRT